MRIWRWCRRATAAGCRLSRRAARPGTPLKYRLDPFVELALRQSADLGRRHLATLEQHHRRDAAHAVFARRLRVLVDIDLGGGDPPGHFGGEFVEKRRDHLAGAAPFGPEVDEN